MLKELSYEVSQKEFNEFAKEFFAVMVKDINLSETLEFVLNDMDISDDYFQKIMEFEGED